MDFCMLASGDGSLIGGTFGTDAVGRYPCLRNSAVKCEQD
jgi:hypothetical protein